MRGVAPPRARGPAPRPGPRRGARLGRGRGGRTRRLPAPCRTRRVARFASTSSLVVPKSAISTSWIAPAPCSADVRDHAPRSNQRHERRLHAHLDDVRAAPAAPPGARRRATRPRRRPRRAARARRARRAARRPTRGDGRRIARAAGRTIDADLRRAIAHRQQRDSRRDRPRHNGTGPLRVASGERARARGRPARPGPRHAPAGPPVLYSCSTASIEPTGILLFISTGHAAVVGGHPDLHPAAGLEQPALGRDRLDDEAVERAGRHLDRLARVHLDQDAVRAPVAVVRRPRCPGPPRAACGARSRTPPARPSTTARHRTPCRRRTSPCRSADRTGCRSRARTSPRACASVAPRVQALGVDQRVDPVAHLVDLRHELVRLGARDQVVARPALVHLHAARPRARPCRP